MLCIRSVKNFYTIKKKVHVRMNVRDLCDPLIILTSTPHILTIRNTML